MKIGKLNFKDYAAQKPIAVLPSGKFISVRDFISQPSLCLGSLFALDNNLQLDLALKRYEMEPDFELGIIDIGAFTKNEIINHIRNQSELGRMALRAEIAYCNELMASLVGKKIPSSPKMPKPIIPKIPDWKPVKKCLIMRLPTRAVFCENTTDPVTTPFTYYRKKYVHPEFRKRGFTVIILEGTEDTRDKFVSHAKNPLTEYLSGVGHGNYNIYTGHWGNIILEECQYDSKEVKNKAIHFLSCKTAAKLGPDTVKKGARCYAGYTENFILVWDERQTRIDEFNLFPESDSVFDIMMARGATAKEAFEAAINAFNFAINKVPNTVAATYLTWDREHLKLIGNPSAKIKPYRFVKICFPIKPLERQDALVEAGTLED
ncbi:hypothetical protein JW926_12105 [Candidatus Sumerlaeota bacterium]|nr:hypothetical protein [Candidatus Sumerlaeota bacterium]